MKHRILARPSAAAVLVLGLSGCADETASPNADPARQLPSQRNVQNVDKEFHNKELEMNEETPRKLIVSLPDEDGLLVRLGVLDFDESNRATLTIEGAGPEVDQLKQNWQEVANQPELLWKKSVPGEVDGEPVMRLVAETVRPGDDHYVYAVLNTLERSYGYRVDFGD